MRWIVGSSLKFRFLVVAVASGVVVARRREVFDLDEWQ